jgi:hypothetical protein
MAQTTTAVNACDAVVQLDKSGGALTNISGSANNVSMNITQNIGEATTFDGDWTIKKACGKSVSVSLAVVYSVTADQGLHVLRDWMFAATPGSRTIQIDIPDGSVGSDRYSGEMVIESLDIPASSDEPGPILVSASLSNDGAFAHTTISS